MINSTMDFPDLVTLYSFARLKVAPEIPLHATMARYDFQRDWHEVACGLHAPIIVCGEEVHDGRVFRPAFAREYRRKVPA